jgi:hypothetical protein
LHNSRWSVWGVWRKPNSRSKLDASSEATSTRLRYPLPAIRPTAESEVFREPSNRERVQSEPAGLQDRWLLPFVPSCSPSLTL